jgi:hypothetical protein
MAYSVRIERLRRWSAVPALLCLLIAAEPARSDLEYETPGAIPGLELGPEAQRHHVVVVSERGVEPARVELVAGERLAWRSASSSRVRIAFDAAVARSTVCTHVVNFALERDRLRSAWLEPGDVASFCQLRPGTYAYAVERDGTPAASGEIVVRAREEARAY